ncbi:phage head closure protein [Bacillus mycoides]|uniref:phage head closure protein n=1 Tax=Bacillus mycoides TaxID=1405 RepID=UPI001F29F009
MNICRKHRKCGSYSEFFIRFRRGIDSKMRVLYEGRLFEIKAVVDVDEQHKETCLVCEERSIWQK